MLKRDKIYLVKASGRGGAYAYVGNLNFLKEMIGKRIKLVPFEVDDKMQSFRFRATFGDNFSEGEVMAYSTGEAREMICTTLESLGRKNYRVEIYEGLQ